MVIIPFIEYARGDTIESLSMYRSSSVEWSTTILFFDISLIETDQGFFCGMYNFGFIWIELFHDVALWNFYLRDLPYEAKMIRKIN